MAPAVKKPAEHQVRLGPPSGSDGTGSACSWEAPLQKGMATKSMGRAAGWPTVSRLPKSWTQPSALAPENDSKVKDLIPSKEKLLL